MTTVLPTGPVMTVPLLGGLPLACGRYLEQTYLTVPPWAADHWKYDDLDIVTGIYRHQRPSPLARPGEPR